MANQEPARSIDKLTGWALFAHVDRDGRVTGITHNGGEDDSGEPDRRGNRHLPLFGDDVAFDLVTEFREGPNYTVEADRVTRSYRVREKTAKEMLTEISWWYRALHSSGGGASPTEVTASMRRSMASMRSIVFPDDPKEQTQ